MELLEGAGDVLQAADSPVLWAAMGCLWHVESSLLGQLHLQSEGSCCGSQAASVSQWQGHVVGKKGSFEEDQGFVRRQISSPLSTLSCFFS